MTWNPDQYAKFSGPRLQPGLDLINRLPADASVTDVVDLGCGMGELTALLGQRFPSASVVGIDSSASMLEKAQGRFPDRAWVEGDISSWRSETPLDLIYSNAVLHWLPDHDSLFPRLLAELTKGGILAVQMPRNFDAPSHRLMREVAN